jgi:predicted homoserine dehydrogenase-like protein
VVDCLDLTDGSVTGFVVTRTDNDTLAAYLHGRGSVATSADGEYQFFHVPFHGAQETALSVARAALGDGPTGQVRSQETEVVAAAKRPLSPGEEVGGGGGDTVYGVLADADRAADEGWVPLELLVGAEVRAPVETDAFVARADVALDDDSLLHALRRVQASGALPSPGSFG